MEKNNKMGTMAMPKLVANMSLPLMISLLVQSLYNIVDSVFVARIGEDALTAVSLAYPVQLFMIAVSVGTSVGVNALLSQSIGAGRKEDTRKIATTGMLLAIFGMAVFMLLGLTCTGLFVSMFTEDEVIGTYCRQYLFICMLFCAGTFIETMFQRFLQAVGDTFDSMISLVAGAVTNLILDPIMIFGLLGFPALGIRGAAVATVIGQWVAAFIAVLLNIRRNQIVRVGLKGYHFDQGILFRIYRVGLPTIVTQALGSVMLTAVNAILISFSSTAVAFFGVYYKLQNFLYMPMNGLGQAAIPIAGYSYGAGRKDRIRELLKMILPLAVGIAVIITIVFMAVPSLLLGIFSASEGMLEIGVPALRIISVTFAFGAVTIILGYSMSGLGNGVVNMMGTALRQVIVLVPCIWLLSKILGVDYAWYAFWISELAGCVYAAWASYRELKKKGILEKE
ncbi:MAG: MATE family efflux transporter [Lachnospiraceae bacterium]|nr:MATE family efflux transporter [Lachnospiraceae bacterium]